MGLKIERWFANRPGLLALGAGVGLLCFGLEALGNPPNMGVCLACFERDIAGALGLTGFAPARYFRPEVAGIVLGALAAAILAGERRSTRPAAPIPSLLLGALAMLGALTFLGCTWRLFIRLGALDLNALTGLAGLVAGVGAAAWIAPHRAPAAPAAPRIPGWLLPGAMAALLAVAGVQALTGAAGPLLVSAKGPGAIYAPFPLALLGGLLLGAVAQRTGFCTVGAFRRALRTREPDALLPLLGFAGAVCAAKALAGTLAPGFRGQPIAHSDHLWNFLGMALCGLSFTLAGGCPGRMLVRAGQGDGDAVLFVLGAILGAGGAHLAGLAAAPDGPGGAGGPSGAGEAAVAGGLVLAAALGFLARRRAK